MTIYTDPETERNFKLYHLYRTGNYTQSSLGRIFKLTRERVRQIIRWSEKNIDPSYPPVEENI